MSFRTCSATACTSHISMGAAFCNHHWHMIPSAMQMSIAGLSKRARSGESDLVQHRLVYALLLARQEVAKAEKRGSQPIAPAYKAKAEQEQNNERIPA